MELMLFLTGLNFFVWIVIYILVALLAQRVAASMKDYASAIEYEVRLLEERIQQRQNHRSG